MIGGDFGGMGAAAALGTDPKKIIEMMSTPGWAGIDALEAIARAQVAKANEFGEADARNDAYLECFSTPAGQLVLTDLVENVILMPSAGLTPGQTVEQHAAFAIAGDAQKMMVWGFLTKMRLALERRNMAQNPADKEAGNAADA